MKRNRSWLSLIGSCTLMALGAALALAVVGAVASAALPTHESSDEPQLAAPTAPQVMPGGGVFEGMVTDSRCSARHTKNSRLNPAECARQCVRQGASYVLVDGNRRYRLVGSEESLEKFAGQRIRINGSRQGETIQVSSAASLF